MTFLKDEVCSVVSPFDEYLISFSDVLIFLSHLKIEMQLSENVRAVRSISDVSISNISPYFAIFQNCIPLNTFTFGYRFEKTCSIFINGITNIICQVHYSYRIKSLTTSCSP